LRITVFPVTTLQPPEQSGLPGTLTAGDEYRECLVKARAPIGALGAALRA
jgi:hypothetical protein